MSIKPKKTTASKTKPAAKKPSPRKLKRPTNDERLLRFLSRAGGTTIEEMQREIKMQVHSIRGSMSLLKKKLGLTVEYDKETKRYRKV